jgi:superfamily II RNA helicase
MIQTDIENEMKEYYDNMSKVQLDIDNMALVMGRCKTPIKVVEEYIDLKERRLQSVNKKRKEIDRAMLNILDQYRDINKDVDVVAKYNLKRVEIEVLESKIKYSELSLSSNIDKIIYLLRQSSFIEDTNVLSLKGKIAANLREVHCLVFAELIESGKLKRFSAKELVGILSCFTNISVPEDKCDALPKSKNESVNAFVQQISNMYFKQFNDELNNHINTGIDYTMHFDLIDHVIKWCECNNDGECKMLLHEVSVEKEVFLGEFVKSILKINNIASEMEKIAELIGDIEFLSILKEIPQLTMKYVATNQSLYV